MPLFEHGKRVVVGMVHAGALPGTPRAYEDIEALIAAAVSDAEIYAGAGFDAVLVENMHDRPYLKGGVGPEIVAAMTRIATAVRQASGLPCGLQILAAANREAMAVALAAGLDFVRVEGFAFAHVADEGLIESSAAELLRYRRQIGAGGVQVLADIKKKHSSHSITADTDLAATARAAEFMLADGLIVTGDATGEPASLADLAEVRAASGLPLCVGSGVDEGNASAVLEHVDGLIVGSSLKVDGRWENAVCPQRAKSFMASLPG